MQIEWLPEVRQCVEFLYGMGSEPDLSLPQNLPDFATSMVFALSSGTYMPVVEIPPYKPLPEERHAIKRTLNDIDNMISWAICLLRANDIDSFFLINEGEIAPSSLIRDEFLDWTFEHYSLASWALAYLFEQVGDVLDHEQFPGCPDISLKAHPENLIAALGFVAFNLMVVNWRCGAHLKAMSLVAAGYETLRHALEQQNQRVGRIISALHARRDLSVRGRRGGAAANAQANRLKAWVDTQPNPTKRTDRPFARQLAKNIPPDLINDFADPERVIYDYLRSAYKNAAT